MNRAAVIFAMVTALCLGASFGFVGGILFTRHHLRPEWPPHFDERLPHRMRGGGPEEHGVPSARFLVPRLQRVLGLSREQAEAIRIEIDSTRGEFAKVRDSLHVRIARHLTAEQLQHWRSMMMRERFPGEPGGPRPRTLRAEPGREGDTPR